ncbi:CinA family nicotinamide mononucleotide deamidase-related protein [Flavobacteriales bacterium]|nr:CinA family nicotinamide mononucleotide deamidase-related protein [Flavobacteriales bacterium]MDA9864085.1 CinA family nicotinamide mononucleotide deamidase-related protein [Flavobacteriales bacterium]
MASGRLLVEILSIGDELLIGQTVNTNAAWMGHLLEKEGWRVNRCVVVSDEEAAIVNALKDAESRAELVLITGGLGPTRDDITKHVLCRHFDTELVRYPDIEDRIVSWFERRGRAVLQVNRDQALLPATCRPLENPLGTASGMWFERSNGITVSMPGVPYEMEHIMEHGVLPSMRDRMQQQGRLPKRAHKSLLTMGTGESQLSATLGDMEEALERSGVKLAYLPSPGSVRIRLTAEDEAVDQLDRSHAAVLERLEEWVVSDEGLTVEEALGQFLVAHGFTLAVAESCTGGALGAALVARPGASAFFLGGVQSYSNAAKEQLLDVPGPLIVEFGAVSEEVARAMAKGARKKFQADFGLSITGIAGPEGGSEDKPVGTVYMACEGPSGVMCVRHQFGRDRTRNLAMSVRSAAQLALKSAIEWGVESKPASRVADSL